MADNNQPEPSLGDELVPPPSKKTKYKSKFHPEWEKEFAGITAYRQDCHRVHCSYCQTNFSIAHGGRHDVVKHVGTPTHTRAYDDAKRSGRQARLFELRQGGKCTSIDLEVAKAEALWSKFVVEHNLPFSVSDCCVFSMVNKIHTKYRPSIQNNTVCALLTCKINSKVPCPQTDIPNKLAKQVKTATMSRNRYFKEHTTV